VTPPVEQTAWETPPDPAARSWWPGWRLLERIGYSARPRLRPRRRTTSASARWCGTIVGPRKLVAAQAHLNSTRLTSALSRIQVSDELPVVPSPPYQHRHLL